MCDKFQQPLVHDANVAKGLQCVLEVEQGNSKETQGSPTLSASNRGVITITQPLHLVEDMNRVAQEDSKQQFSQVAELLSSWVSYDRGILTTSTFGFLNLPLSFMGSSLQSASVTPKASLLSVCALGFLSPSLNSVLPCIACSFACIVVLYILMFYFFFLYI